MRAEPANLKALSHRRTANASRTSRAAHHMHAAKQLRRGRTWQALATQPALLMQACTRRVGVEHTSVVFNNGAKQRPGRRKKPATMRPCTRQRACGECKCMPMQHAWCCCCSTRTTARCQQHTCMRRRISARCPRRWLCSWVQQASTRVNAGRRVHSQ